MNITKKILNEKIAYANKTLDTTIINKDFSGFNHLMIKNENLFIGTNKECVDFLDGLIKFHLLTK